MTNRQDQANKGYEKAMGDQAHPGFGDIEFLARWLDQKFAIPFTNLRFGLDVLIGLIPVVGDGAVASLGLYIIARSVMAGVGFFTILHMFWNLLLDLVLGSFPLLGDFFDIAFRSNVKNAKLLADHLEKQDRKNQATPGL